MKSMHVYVDAKVQHAQKNRKRWNWNVTKLNEVSQRQKNI